MNAAATTSGESPDHDRLRRNASRLAAVQALYQIEATQDDADRIIKDFLIGRVGGIGVTESEDTATENIVRLPALDTELFVDLVRTAQSRETDIDEMIKNSVSAEWPWERLEMILRAILRASIAELLARTDVPASVTIAEFVDVAHAFYGGPEPRMVNAILDRLARALGRLETKK